MALVACKECEKEVSTRAKFCPHCGIDNPGVKTKDVLLYLLALLLLIAAIFAYRFFL